MQYVIVDARRNWLSYSPDSVLIVEKQRPEWQAGRLNLVGGKIEAGEEPEEAAVRELVEESGITDIVRVNNLGKIEDGDAVIHCVQVVVGSHLLKKNPDETETVMWRTWVDVERDPRLIPNLRIIVPLMRYGVKGFVIRDGYRSKKGQSHTLEVVIPDPEEKKDE